MSNREFLLYPIDTGEDPVCHSFGCKGFGTFMRPLALTRRRSSSPWTICSPGETSG